MAEPGSSDRSRMLSSSYPMDEAVAQCIRIRYLEHALESSKRKSHARTPAFKLSDAPFDAVVNRFAP